MGLGDYLYNPLVNLAMTMIGGKQEQRAYEEAREANIAQWQRGMDALGRLRDRTVPAIDRLTRQLRAQYRAMPRREAQRWENLSRDITGRYDRRTAEAMGMLEGAGEQERANIEEGYDALAAAQRQEIMQRGLGYSSALTGEMRGVERGRRQALGELGESLRRERLGTFAQLSGESLAAREQLGTTGFANRQALLQSNLAARERLGMLGPEWQRALTSGEVDWISQLQHAYPTSPSMWSVLAQRFQPANEPPPEPKTDWIGPQFEALGSMMGGVGQAGGFKNFFGGGSGGGSSAGGGGSSGIGGVGGASGGGSGGGGVGGAGGAAAGKTAYGYRPPYKWPYGK